MLLPGQSMTLSVIVATRNESANVGPLLTALHAALGGLAAEIIVVDDSSDDTPAQVLAVAEGAGHPVRLLHREVDERVGGLGGAVLAGLRCARGDWAVVMDGDLQHPPGLVPELLAAGQRSGVDLVVASRYAGAGGAQGLANRVRSFVSRGATTLAKATFPRRLAECTDPMSGFFAVRRAAVDLDRLRPRGFKILLEIIVRSVRLPLTEVPFQFGVRLSGRSKASIREGLRYAGKLVSLRCLPVRGASARTGRRAAGFGAVGVSGIVVNSLALWLLVGVAGVHLLLGAALATQLSTVWNFVLTDRLVFAGAKRLPGWSRLAGFVAVNNAVLLFRLPLLSLLVTFTAVGYLLANVVTLLAAFAVRFVVSDRLLFSRGVSMTLTSGRIHPDATSRPALPDRATPAPSRRPGTPVNLVVDLRPLSSSALAARSACELVYRYDIHGILTIGSAVMLGELEAFRRDGVQGPMDIEIRPGRVGEGTLRRRPRVTQFATPVAVAYQEHLGRAGSDFLIEMSDRIEVVVGPLLVRSPHVLYTNVVEALLRFALVSRGYMLLHSACLELDGCGVMLSALTDTGKTGTILRLLRENDARFLSDDMTIIGPDGVALSYPKPLTISQHTLRAVNAGDLTPGEWRRLRVQSRLHSREGRGIGARLGRMNLPIMSLNAVTQLVVPPPKYAVDRLVPCWHARSVKIEEIFVIERDDLALHEIDPAGLADELIVNTDDAYGFPPFAYFAPALVIGGLGYEELRARERAILVSALGTGVRARRLATPDYSWADRIPALVSRRVRGLTDGMADGMAEGMADGMADGTAGGRVQQEALPGVTAQAETGPPIRGRRSVLRAGLPARRR